MTNRELRRQINRLAWPIVASTVLIRGAGIADFMILGQTGKEPLAAIGLGQQITFVGMALAYALMVGVNVMVAYYTGARETEKRTRVANSAVWLSILVGLCMIIIGETLSRPLARLIGAEGEVLDLFWKYLRLIWLFYTFNVFVYVLTAIFQGTGNSRTPMYVVSVTGVIHIALTYILVFGKLGFPPMGIEGAAVATIVADFLGAATLFILALKKGFIKFSVGSAKSDDLKQLLELSLPVLGDRLLVSGSVYVYNSFVFMYSVAAYAAMQIVINIEAFSFLPGMAYMQTTQILVGQNLGEKNLEGAVRSGYQSSWIALGIMSLFGLTFLLFPSAWVSLFTKDPEVIPLGIYVCRLAAAIQPVLALTMVFQGALRGAGETGSVMFITFVGAWLVRLVLAFVFTHILNLSVHYVFWAMFIDWSVRSMMAFGRFRSGRWKLAQNLVGEVAK